MYKIVLCAMLLTMMGCKTQKDMMTKAEEPVTEEEIYTTVVDTDDYEERELDELVVSAPREYNLPRYNPAEDRAWDLLHMDLDLRFDWTNEKVFGRADISMRPYFYDQSSVTLDAQGFEIIDIASANGSSLPFNYNGKKLEIELGENYKKEQEVVLTIDYVAHPAACRRTSRGQLSDNQ